MFIVRGGSHSVTDFLDTFCRSNESLPNLTVNNDKQNSDMKTDRSESSSHSSLKIPTPIKAMIRLKSSPKENGNRTQINCSQDKPSSPLMDRTVGKRTVNNSGARKLAHSSNILNFKAYINSADSDIRETVEDVKTYLNFADNGQI